MMTNTVDPKSLGLSARTTVEQIDHTTLAIVIKRKSRLVMADGAKISANATKIKMAKPGKRVMVKTSAPVCSKTLQFLADKGIEVIMD